MKMRKIKSISSMPKDAADPAHQSGNLGRSQRELRRRFDRILKGVRSLVADQSKYITAKTANSVEWQPLSFFTNSSGELDTIKSPLTINKGAYYEYKIDSKRYREINSFIERLLFDELLESYSGTKPPNWFFQSYLSSAFNDGINDAIRSIQDQSDYKIVGDEINRQIMSLSSDDFNVQAMDSLGLVYSRVFNEMEGLTDEMKVDLSETLTRGMAGGLGIRAIASDIQKRVGVGFVRAQRIARTEILNAYRTAQRNKSKEINDTVYKGSRFEMLQLWFSALAATSRIWHVKKHGEIYTEQEVSEFYLERGNAINCLCSQSPILVYKKTGKAVVDGTVKRLQNQKEQYLSGGAK